MARCDEGYRCEVCGRDVETIVDSDLYLRYVLGEIPLESLHLQPERHITCHPALAQYIVHDDFPPVTESGAFDKRALDAAFRSEEEIRVTRGWCRLQDLPTLGIALVDYPLSKFPGEDSR